MSSNFQNLKQLNGLFWENIPEEIESQILSNSDFELEEIKKIGNGELCHSLIESDNLAALDWLNRKGELFDIIYIDPPYNTGQKDFNYTDHFQADHAQLKHSAYLSFMYKRLKLAINLMHDESVLFISIDDSEQARLKLLCDGLLGEENFVANMVRKNKVGSGHDSKQVAVEYDYVLCYAKNINRLRFTKAIVDTSKDPKYKLEDQHLKRRGKYYLRDLDYKGSYSQSLDYAIESPDGEKIWPGKAKGKPNTWRWSKQKVEWGLAHDFIVFKKREGHWKAYIKQYEHVDNKDQIRKREVPHRALIEFNNANGSKTLKSIVDEEFFTYPKPVELMEYLFALHPNKNAKILDFFAGSGTSAHACMSLNKKDKGKRQFTIVTNNENGICEKLTFPRINRLIKGYQPKNGKKVVGLTNNQLCHFQINFKS